MLDKEFLRYQLNKKNIKIADIAKAVGCTQQNINYKIAKNKYHFLGGVFNFFPFKANSRRDLFPPIGNYFLNANYIALLLPKLLSL